MDERWVSMEFHEEYAKRMQEEHMRQNHRISNLEKDVKESTKLAIAVERLTLSLERMVQEQQAQGIRLESLEKQDGEKWRKFVGYIIAGVVGIVLGFLFKQIGM